MLLLAGLCAGAIDWRMLDAYPPHYVAKKLAPLCLCVSLLHIPLCLDLRYVPLTLESQNQDALPSVHPKRTGACPHSDLVLRETP
jgi:hypothetical protein